MMEVQPDYREFQERVEEGYDFIPLCGEILGDRLTPIALMEKFSDRVPIFLLESAERGEVWGRYSFLVFDVDEEVIFSEFCDVISYLGRIFPLRRIYPSLALPFLGGAVGFLSYDAVKTWEMTVPRKPLDFPLAYFALARRFLYFDHLKHRLGVVYVAKKDEYHVAKRWIEMVIERAENDRFISMEENGFRLTGEIVSNFTRASFEEAVGYVRKLIEEGHASQVVISQRFTVPYEGNPFLAYRFLRSLNPSPYLFYCKTSAFTMFGSSPEMLTKLENGRVWTKPVAGTRKRVPGMEEERVMQELLADEKENAEHVMLLDLGRNDLGRIAVPGTVRVEEFMKVERYSHVFHIVSTVSGKVKSDLTPWEVLKATFPAGTVSGAPKVRAMQIIEEVEPQARGPYAGALGYVSFQGNMDTCILIRSIFCKDGKARIQAGAGVVYDSIPEREYEETRSKAEALLLALQSAERRKIEV
ncbi:MAG: anthranilate synthase component I family protein [Atribacterota bacterium]|nr:anthranilate synthase component I family protein [Atribacterota bacterium]